MKRLHQVIGAATLALLIAAAASGDTVRLKNGTQYQGTIQTETDTNLEIEVANPAGTIFHTIEIDKADVASVARTTPEERAAMEMESTYKQTLKYQLDPQYSQPLPYYSQIISNVFYQYLNKYPGSPHEKDMADRIAGWTAERDKVASGLARIGADWLPAAEVSKRLEEAHVMDVIEKGNKLTVAGRYEEALAQYRQVPDLSHRKDLVDQAKHAYAETCRIWIDVLERQHDPLTAEIKDAEAHLSQVRGERDQAESKMHQASAEANSNPNTVRIGEVSSQYQMQYNLLRNQYDDIDRDILSRKQQLTGLESLIARVKAAASAGNALVGATEPPVKVVVVTNTPPPAVAHQEDSPEPTPDVLVQVADYFKRYWVIGLVGFVAIAWACTRAFSR